MVQKTPVVMSDDNKQHNPLGETDTIRVGDIPLSAASGNTLQARSDGLYNGTTPPPDYTVQYVDNVNGNDSTGTGTRAAPYKTIARAAQNIVPGTRGYTIYCYENQDHVMPMRSFDGVTVTFSSYPSAIDPVMTTKCTDAWFAKYGTLLAFSALADAYKVATLIPDRSDNVKSNQVGGPYVWMEGMRSYGGNVNFTAIKIRTGKKDADFANNGVLRAAFLTDDDLSQAASFNINYCDVELGSLPLINQRGAGSPCTLGMYACKITGVADDKGEPQFITGWTSADAPAVNVYVGGVDDGTEFVTVDGVDYHIRNTLGAAAYAKAQTVNAYYYEDIPLNIVGPFMYGAS